MARRRRRDRQPWIRRAFILACIAFATLVLMMVVYRFINPPFTPMMLVDKLKGETLERQWVPIGKISPNLPLAVIASEDGQFCRHWGVDWGAVREANREARKRGEFRGASTITMQTVKNLFLWSPRSYVRKVIEVPLAHLMTLLWPKKRTIEVYLNIVEWGPGIYGAEAASRHYFNKSASALSAHESALLAAALPSPLTRNPGKPGPRILRHAAAVERRMPIMADRAACVR
jgi:monofunctional biosynthetic peptidoglycan transglycosylase